MLRISHLNERPNKGTEGLQQNTRQRHFVENTPERYAARLAGISTLRYTYLVMEDSFRQEHKKLTT